MMMRFAALLSVAAALCRIHVNHVSAFSAKSRSITSRRPQGTLSLAAKADNDGDDVAPDGNRRLLFAAGGFAAAATLAPTNTNAASGPYAPAPGSMDGKVVVITGGNTGKLQMAGWALSLPSFAH